MLYTEDVYSKKPIVRVLSSKAAREAIKAQRRLIIATNQIRAFELSGQTDLEELETLEAAADEAMATYRSHLVKGIKYLPSDWLVEDAPKDLKWEDQADMDWIKNNKVRVVFDLIQGLVEEAEENAKN